MSDSPTTVETIDTLQADLESQLATSVGLPTAYSAASAGTLFNGRILDWVARRVQEGVLTPERKAAIREAALRTFDAWDIPYIAGFVEAGFKAWLRPQLENALDKLLGL